MLRTWWHSFRFSRSPLGTTIAPVADPALRRPPVSRHALPFDDVGRPTARSSSGGTPLMNIAWRDGECREAPVIDVQPVIRCHAPYRATCAGDAAAHRRRRDSIRPGRVLGLSGSPSPAPTTPVAFAAVPPAIAAIVCGSQPDVSVTDGVWAALAVAIIEQQLWGYAAIPKARLSGSALTKTILLNIVMGLIIVALKVAISH